jgi:prolyl-tRNA synthetase
LGTTRLVGAIVEASHDERGIIWPAEVSPFPVHIVALFGKDAKINKKVRATADAIYNSLSDDCCGGCSCNEPLYDDRADASAGEKFAVSDLLGIPNRIVISEKTLAQNSIELKNRKTGKVTMKKLK